MKLNWLSPGGCSKAKRLHTGSALRPHAQVTSWTPNIGDGDGTAGAGLLHTDSFVSKVSGQYMQSQCVWRRFNGADGNVFDLRGDPITSGWIWDLCQLSPGIALLTNGHCLSFFAERLLSMPGGRYHFRDMMFHWYGEAGRQAARMVNHSTDVAPLEDRFSAIELVGNCALAIVVHDGYCLHDLEQRAGIPVFEAPLPFELECKKPHPPRFPSHGASIMVLFRRSLGNRLGWLIDALGQLPITPSLTFKFICAPLDVEEVQRRTSASALIGRATTMGKCPESSLVDELETASLVINLETDPPLDAAWRQLGMMAYGLPTIVPDTGWFRSLPPHLVGLVRTGSSAHFKADLVRHVSRPENSPDLSRRWQVEQATRWVIDRHNPSRFAEVLMDVLRRVPELRRERALQETSRRVDHVSGSWLDKHGRSRSARLAASMFGVR